MDRTGLRVPLFAVLLVSHQGFALPSTWADGIDRFAREARDAGAAGIGLAFSPTKPKDGYGKVHAIFAALRRVKQVSGLPVFGWRQGIFGAALAAAGVDGYETGAATGESCDVMSAMTSRRPREGKKHSGGSTPGIFIDALGRSVPVKVGELLLASSLRARIICDDERCCPDGAPSTLAHPREHAIRTRARQLRSLDALPHVSWRLHQVAKDAVTGSTVVKQANEVLKAAGLPGGLPPQGLDSVAKVARQLAEEVQANAA
jgi:hypothetical protein